MKSLISSKKGQVGTLGPAMIALVFAAVVLVFGLIITQQIRDTDIVAEAISGTTTNESGGYINATGYTLAQSTLPGFANPSITTIHNNSDGLVILAGNYTLTGNVITNATVTNWDPVNITYTYTYGDQAYVTANETVVGLGTFADFWEIIVLAIVITVVIGLLLVVFGGSRRR